MAETWFQVAQDSRKAASQLVDTNFRSAVARAYFAAYAKLAQELIDAGAQMPKDREGPSHKKLQPMIETQLTSMGKEKRAALSNLIGQLYTLRIYADYKPSIVTAAREAREAISLMHKIFYFF